jgi:hypothetical protein
MLSTATALAVSWAIFAGELGLLGWLLLRRPRQR